MKGLTKEQEFIVFCLEKYKETKNIDGTMALNDFKKYNVFEFLENSYDILHSQSMNYVTDEIIQFIKTANEVISR